MEKLQCLLEELLNIDLINIVISGARGSGGASKIKIRPVLLKGQTQFQATRYVDTKVLHDNYGKAELAPKIMEWMADSFRQMQIQSQRADVTVLVSKKGKVTIKRREKADSLPDRDQALPQGASFDMIAAHNREKQYILKEGQPVDFLVDLGVMTREGKVVRAKYDKFRQINRFLEFIKDILPALERGRRLHMIDFGCGKSYLTFAMYYYLRELNGFDIEITGLDLKKDVIEHCNSLARRYGYEHLQFLHGDIASYEGQGNVDMVVTLHACDTATDAALYKAVLWNAKVILSVPCCQHELNRQIQCPSMSAVFQYGLLKERMAALVTDGLRAELLNAAGYKTQVLEFIDMEHTPKNILIRAVREKHPRRISLTSKYLQCQELLNVTPMLETLLLERFGAPNAPSGSGAGCEDAGVTGCAAVAECAAVAGCTTVSGCAAVTGCAAAQNNPAPVPSGAHKEGGR